ncbi:quinone oxidoreductase family protein [Rhodopseudomonas sp. P2A-2r]|uniref:quinone oxidoreductase family protein n=1 Tax=unclassified Rhodopseudomonas TaxID=2638247 RepID=UPI0022347699|nr:quinone oxidoreductase [Rhodopseudomonas sp. P2A-2r]UZE50258.1 quinone oxidoreductase [Rhodopseudomonas sp. P2A-2r]
MTTIIRLKAPGGIEQLECVTVELPPPGPDEIRIRHTAIGVNFIDIYHRMGMYPLSADAVPGVEAAGVVAAIGTNVSSVQIGDRIAYAGSPVGAYASERNLPAWRAIRLPDDLSDEVVASSLLKGITAYMLLNKVFPAGVGTTMLVHSAAGGLGQLLIRWARHLGATVVGTVSSESKAVIARDAGAQQVIVGRDADFAAEVAVLTDGRGVDVAYDGVGGTTLAKTLGCVRPFGVVASFGQAGGPIPLLDVNDLGPRRSILLGRPSVMAYVNNAEDYHRGAAAVLDALSAGVLRASGRAYPLVDAVVAQADLEAGRTSGSLYLVP